MRSRSMNILKLLWILYILIQPPEMAQAKFIDSNNNKQPTKLAITNTFENETHQNELSYYESFKEMLTNFLNTSRVYLIAALEKIDPVVKQNYIQIILLIIIFALIISLIKKNLQLKEKVQKAIQIPKHPSSEKAENNSTFDENEGIPLIGRMNKKPKLDVDYGSVFKQNSKASKNKNLEKEMKLSENNRNHPLFEYANIISEQERIQSHSYSDNYIANLRNQHAPYLNVGTKSNNNFDNEIFATNKDIQQNMKTPVMNSSSYFGNSKSFNPQSEDSNSGFNQFIYVPYNFDQQNNNDNTKQQNNEEFDILEVFSDNKNKRMSNNNQIVSNIIESKGEKASKQTDAGFSFSNSTSNITFYGESLKERNCHDDFLDFFSNVDKTEVLKPTVDKSENKDSQNILEKGQKVEKANTSVDKIKENLPNGMEEILQIHAKMKEKREKSQSDASCTKEETSKVQKKVEKLEKLRMEYQPPMDKILEEDEDNRKESDTSISNSQLLHSSEDYENSMENENQEDKIVKRLKKLKLKRCMIKI